MKSFIGPIDIDESMDRSASERANEIACVETVAEAFCFKETKGTLGLERVLVWIC